MEPVDYCSYVVPARCKRIISVLLMFAAFLSPGWAQEWAAEIRLSEKAVVSIVTIYPGEALYSMYGHTAVRIFDHANDIDLLYNYGQASVPFDSGFVPRFVSGDLPFILGVSDSQRAFHFYRTYEDRTVYEQVLDLSTGQKQAVLAFLAENAKKENRTYIYDFFFDNCTTRVRDLLHEVFDSTLQLAPVSHSSGDTYRQHIAPYLNGVPYVKLGIDLMLGSLADMPVTAEHDLYLPLQLMEAVEDAQLEAEAGKTGFVKESRYLERQRRPDPQPPFPGPGLVMWIILAAAVSLSLLGKRSAAAGRIFDFIVYFGTGAVGCAAVMLWAFSGYEMTTMNINILWAWPTHLAAAFFFLFGYPKRGLSADRTGGTGWDDQTGRNDLAARNASVGIRSGVPTIIRAPFPLYLVLNATVTLAVLILSPFYRQHLPFEAIPLMITLILRSVVRTGTRKRIQYAQGHS